MFWYEGTCETKLKPERSMNIFAVLAFEFSTLHFALCEMLSSKPFVSDLIEFDISSLPESVANECKGRARRKKSGKATEKVGEVWWEMSRKIAHGIEK